LINDGGIIKRMEELSRIVKTMNVIAFGNTIMVNMDQAVVRRCYKFKTNWDGDIQRVKHSIN
jgi:hypothetical protein